MNILFIVPYTPTLIRTRPYNLIRSLLRRGHSVTLATLWETEAEHGSLDELAGQGIRVIAARLTRTRSALNLLRALASGTPLQAEYCWQPELARKLSHQSSVISRQSSVVSPPWLVLPEQAHNATDFIRPQSPNSAGQGSQYDVIHVEHLRGAKYGLFLKSLTSDLRSPIPNPQSLIPNYQSPLAYPPGQAIPNPYTPVPIVWDSVDCISLLFEAAARNSRSRSGRWVTRAELERTRRYEGWLVGQFDRVLATSAADAEALKRLAEGIDCSKPRENEAVRRELCSGNVFVLPNGVDLEYFRPNFGPRAPDTVVLTGKMSYHANVTAALYLVEEVMPHVWARRPGVKVSIVGSAPPPEVRALAARDPARVSVTGSVPDLRPYLQSAAVAVAPVPYGAGIQNKVLEAMACGTPVVATTQAASALKARAGEDLRLADGPEAFAAEILRLLEDEPFRQRIGENGHRYVCKHHHWAAIAERLEGVYLELLGLADLPSAAVAADVSGAANALQPLATVR